MCVSEASVAKAMLASGVGCASGTACVSTCLLLLKPASKWGDHCRIFLPPLSVVMRGSRTSNGNDIEAKRSFDTKAFSLSK